MANKTNYDISFDAVVHVNVEIDTDGVDTSDEEAVSALIADALDGKVSLSDCVVDVDYDREAIIEGGNAGGFETKPYNVGIPEFIK